MNLPARQLMTALCTLLCVQGLSWVVFGSFEPTGWYDGLLAQSQLGAATLPEDAARVQRFLLVLFGATDAAYFALAGFVVHHAFDERWAWRAVASSFGLWFTVDTAGSLWLGATFNVLVVNLPCLALFGVGLALWRSALSEGTSG